MQILFHREFLCVTIITKKRLWIWEEAGSTAEVGTRERGKSDLHAIFMDEVLKKTIKDK